MFLDASTWEALAIVGGVGGLAGLIGGFISSANSLFGAILMGVIGGIAGSTIMRIAGASSIASVGDGFSLVWAAVGGLLLGYVVGRSD
ncbi:MAG TPA: hypothetical protein VLA91_04270 [Acidimicrobiia bacterium]|nr:hypothetical protein [Acidimicrobiia bacterium]